MAVISNKDKEKLKKRFLKLQTPIKLVTFTQAQECTFCAQNRELVEELTGISDNISMEIKDFVGDKTEAEKLHVDKIPAIAILGAGNIDYGIRFYGIPAGYEFMSLIESVEVVSSRDSGLSAQSKAILGEFSKPVHLQVYVTPTCPYCPRAVVLAFRLAVQSNLITADMVEATEFPHLANKYGVSGVPHTVIGNSAQPMVGVYPEHAALEMIFTATQSGN